ncbi:MAG: hypothetical protein ACR2KV_06045 [Solirubrobacteraceae bacterium]
MEAISGELSGVLNRMLGGVTRLRREGAFTECSGLTLAHAEFRHQADSTAMYLLDVDDKGRSKREAWYAWYADWCNVSTTATILLLASGSTPGYAIWTLLEGVTVVATKNQGYEYFTVTRKEG